MCSTINRTINHTLLLSFIFFFVNLFVLIQAPLASEQSAISVYSHASSLNYSEASAVYQMYKDQWQDFPKANGSRAFSRNRLVLGTQLEIQNQSSNHVFSMEYIERNDLLVSFTPDTAKIFYYQAQDRNLPDNQLFNVHLSVQQLAANGVRFGYQTPKWNNLRLVSQLSLLHGKEFQEGHINGQIFQQTNSQGKKEYQGQGQIDYHYQQDRILKHQLNQPSGQGLTLDFKLNWQYQDWNANLVIEDALQYMRWNQLGHKNGGIGTKNMSTDDSGFVRYKAMFSGYLGEYNYSPQSLPRYSRAEIAHSWQQWQLSSGAWHYHNQAFPFLAGRYLWQQQQLGLNYELNSQKLTLDYRYHRKKSTFSLAFGSNSWNPKLAHALEVQLGGYYQF